MKIVRGIQAIFAVSVLVGTLAVGARADTYNKTTIFTFNQQVEIPGQILPAGTYQFKLLDSVVNRNVVQVFNGDGSQLIATVLTINDSRVKPSGKAVIMFGERPANAPPAVKSWFYPGEKGGQEFVYPKARAVLLAQETHEAVPAVAAEPAPVEELKSEPIVAETPQKTEVEVAEAFPTPAPSTAPSTERLAPVLPKTGSPVPLIALLGVLSVSFAFTLKRLVS